jgi:Cu2+-exporting ATPase
VTAAWWYWHDPDRALWVFVSVLVVSCPCALSLATPVALTVATDALARMGVLTRGHAIEGPGAGRPFRFRQDRHAHLRRDAGRAAPPAGPCRSGGCAGLAAALEQGSEHAIAAALRLRVGRAALPAFGLAATTGQGVPGSLTASTIASAARLRRRPAGTPVPEVLLETNARADGDRAGVGAGLAGGFASPTGCGKTARRPSSPAKGIALSIFSGDTPFRSSWAAASVSHGLSAA